MKLLQDRFGKPQKIISAHMEEFLKLPERQSTLRFLYKITIHIRGLESLGAKSERYGSLLIPVIMAKLPPELRLGFARDTTKEVWESEELMETVRKEVEARETANIVRVVSRPNNLRPSNPPMASTSALVSANFSVKCVYYGEQHFFASCLKIRSTRERKALLLGASIASRPITSQKNITPQEPVVIVIENTTSQSVSPMIHLLLTRVMTGPVKSMLCPRMLLMEDAMNRMRELSPPILQA